METVKNAAETLPNPPAVRDRNDAVPDDGRNGRGAGAVAVSEGAAIIQMIERAARDPSVDLDKMERLFAMHERVQSRRAQEQFNAAMASAQAEIAPVARNKKNEHSGAKYADLFAIADKALPIAHQHGFGLSFSEFKSEQPNCLGVACKVSHAGGHSERYEFNVPLDRAGSQGKVNKTETQAYGSTFTYGRRYATCGVFNIAITDDDGGTKQAAIDDRDAALAALRVLVEKAGANEGKICGHFSVESFDDLTARQISEASAGLSARIRKAKP